MGSIDTGGLATSKVRELNADAWGLLVERSRALVHNASSLMGVLTHPALPDDDADQAAGCAATDVALAARALDDTLASAPELAAHRRTIARFEVSLAAWRGSVADGSPLRRRYQTALLQQATQVLTSCLHVQALATSESERCTVSRQDIAVRADPASP